MKEKSVLTGKISHILFQNPEAGYVVFVIKSGQNEFTAKGHTFEIKEGLNVSLRGVWEHNSKYGEQLNFDDLEIVLSNKKSEVVDYLGSGLFKGIGMASANKIWDAFGEETINTIEHDPDKLFPILGKKAASFLESWDTQKTHRDFFSWLLKYNISVKIGKKIIDTYWNEEVEHNKNKITKEDAISNIKENPYILAYDVKGIGFKKADEIALSMGIDEHSQVRYNAAIRYFFDKNTTEGKCGVQEEEIHEGIQNLIRHAQKIKIVEAIDVNLSNGNIKKESIDDIPYFFDRYVYYAEDSIAKKLITYLNQPFGISGDIKQKISDAADTVGVELNSDQQNAIETIFSSKLSVITGKPGTGKTTILNVIQEVLNKEGKQRITFLAPTGKAAKRIRESVGTKNKTGTIHRVLKVIKNKSTYDGKNNPFPTDILIIDETSMMDVFLTSHMLNALSPKTNIIFVGDVNQLPSIGPGSVLKDIINSGVVPTAKLEQIMRQAAESKIIAAAHAINNGEMPEFGPPDCFFMNGHKEQALTQIDRMIDRILELGYDFYEDVQILTPMQKTLTGVEALNKHVQNRINPKKTDEHTLLSGAYEFRVGDKVMQIANDYEKILVSANQEEKEGVFNGDTGIITSIHKQGGNWMANVEFDEGTAVYTYSELSSLTLAYAVTIHKFQGSEAKIILLPYQNSHYVMFDRNLLYTAVTRAREKCIIIGDKQAIAQTVKTVKQNNRVTRLKLLLPKYLKELQPKEENETKNETTPFKNFDELCASYGLNNKPNTDLPPSITGLIKDLYYYGESLDEITSKTKTNVEDVIFCLYDKNIIQNEKELKALKLQRESINDTKQYGFKY